MPASPFHLLRELLASIQARLLLAWLPWSQISIQDAWRAGYSEGVSEPCKCHRTHAMTNTRESQ